jgi:hypothetical protein
MYDTYAALIDDILAGSNMSTVTAKHVREQLQTKVAHDISPHKDDMADLIMERYDAVSAGATPGLIAAGEDIGEITPSKQTPTAESSPMDDKMIEFSITKDDSQQMLVISPPNQGLSPGDEVFGITELAELIIQYLDHQDMARLRYTNRRCHDLIGADKEFLRAWYFEPVEGGTVKPVRAPVHANPKRVRWVTTVPPAQEYTPVTGQIATSHAAASSSTGEQSTEQESSQPVPGSQVRAVIRSTSLRQARQFQQPPVLNPHLQHHFPKWSYYAINNMVGLEQAIPEAEAWSNPDASWRAMLLMQPPVGDVLIVDWLGKRYKAWNERGVTMGDVYDAVDGGEEF